MGKQRFRYSASILKPSHLFATIGALLTILLGSLLLLALPNLGEQDFSQLYLEEHGNVPFELLKRMFDCSARSGTLDLCLRKPA